MDYEKAYKDALDRARKMMDSKRSVVIGKQALETIFPELSESEDERIRKEIIDFIQWAEDRGMTRHDYHQAKRPAVWLAYLEKQKEQKPAEWSEGDEDMLNSCISSIEEAKENRYAYKETDGDTSYDHEIAWLKSLRPSWKPSEEQIDALKELIDDANRAGWVTPGATELYEQLKKL